MITGTDNNVPLLAPVATPQETSAEALPAVSIICSKASLDMAYPGLILANAARMTGIEANLFFTFWGLDVVTESTIDGLHLATVGNPGLHVPTMLGGLPGVSAAASAKMRRDLDRIDIPPIREMIEILDAAGAKIYACSMAMDMFGRTEDDLVPEVNGVISAMDFFDKAAGSQLLFI